MSDAAKDLFRSLFARVSLHSFETYDRKCLQLLPSLLLHTARESCPAVADCVGFEELQRCLEVPATEAQSWRNAELYPYLNYAAFPHNSKLQLCINALRVHCGIADLAPNMNQDVQYWRLRQDAPDSGVKVVRFDNRSAIELRDIGWSFAINGRSISVYRPHEKLFDDVEPRLYGSQASTRSNGELDSLLRQAFSLISCYSEFLSENISNCISTISFLKELDNQRRPISFSLRNKFIGAIFITVTTPLEIAEQIIHEYYHQSIWPWWLVEPPVDLPDTDVKVISPITGAERSLPTMIQAILIYASLLDFYTFASEHGHIDSEAGARDRAISRVRTIRERFDDLAASVTTELEHRPASLAVVRAIIDLRSDTLVW